MGRDKDNAKAKDLDRGSLLLLSVCTAPPGERQIDPPCSFLYVLGTRCGRMLPPATLLAQDHAVGLGDGPYRSTSRHDGCPNVKNCEFFKFGTGGCGEAGWFATVTELSAKPGRERISAPASAA